jgi:hypothetical protein
MAISITSLFPEKNEINVPVSSNITVVLESDTYDLDVQSVRFYINGLRIRASSKYSLETLSAQDKKIVEVTFYARRRIKFANERYGAPDTRYGKQDVLISNFMYSSRYVCRVEIDDFAGNTFSDYFSFSTEQGVFYNTSPEEYFYYSTSQQLANFLPEWSKARFDKFSVFQQTINPAASFIEAIDNKIQFDFLNLFAQTANYNELANLYKIEFGASSDFKTTILNDGTSLQIPPKISALLNITKIYPTAEFNNDLQSVFYNKLPSRIEADKTKINPVFLPLAACSKNKVVLNKTLDRPGSLSVNVYNGTEFIKSDGNATTQDIVTLRIEGISTQEVDQIEDIVIFENASYVTQKLWNSVKSVQLINITDDCNIDYSITYLPPADAKVLDVFKHCSEDNLVREAIWSLFDNQYGSVLCQEVYLEQEINQIVLSQGAKTQVNEYQLLDVDRVTPIDAIAVCCDPFSYNLYVIDQEHLYLYDKREPYSSAVKLLKKSPTDPDIVLELSTDNLARNEDGKFVEASISHKIIDREPYSYVLSIQYPDNTVYYVRQNQTLTLNKKEAEVILPLGTVVIESSPLLMELVQLGDHIISLEVKYRNGSVSIDQKIARCLSKSAIAKYKLARALNNLEAVNIKRDFDGSIKILDEDDGLSTLIFGRDAMLIDYEKGVVYFTDKYEEVYSDD